ncbi:MAG: translation elongation factor 4 [Candidatus Sumerlaeia bacterium]
MNQQHIRNFCIIAHIDHGKSTLADRLLEYTLAVDKRKMKEQLLDTLELERERGITIKAQAVRFFYKADDGHRYQLNLIDTPGHVDFTYEVSRSISACEGALLVVDATQGVEAQTLANVYLALEHDLEIIPVINKIDLPGADVEGVKAQIHDIIGLSLDHCIEASAKEGIGIHQILETIVRVVPPPRGEPRAPLRALIFDSSYDNYKGVITYIRVVDGTVHQGDRICMMAAGTEYEVIETGVFRPEMEKVEALHTGEVGYVCATIKDIHHIKIGDTMTGARRPATQPLEGFREVKPVVFAGIYPERSDDYDDLRDAIEKYRLNDAAFHVEPETSTALGFGFRCGFLGLLHMEIVQERLEREFGANLIITAPSVNYRVIKTDGEELYVDNPSKLPPANHIARIEQPCVELRLFFPSRYIGAVMQLCQNLKGEQKKMEYLSTERVQMVYEVPLSEIITDFHDRLKSVTQGYASLDYEIIGYRPGNIVRLDMLINGEPVDALTIMVDRRDAERKGRALAEKLRRIVPRQLYEVRIQAAVGSKIVASERIAPLRKDVTAKCYGGDITRKRKLLEKQKEGKKRMKQLGRIEIPQEAFMAVLRLNDE